MLSGVKNLNYFPLFRTSVYHPIPSGNMAEKNGGNMAEAWPRRIDSAEVWRLFQHVVGFMKWILVVCLNNALMLASLQCVLLFFSPCRLCHLKWSEAVFGCKDSIASLC